MPVPLTGAGLNPVLMVRWASCSVQLKKTRAKSRYGEQSAEP